MRKGTAMKAVKIAALWNPFGPNTHNNKRHDSFLWDTKEEAEQNARNYSSITEGEYNSTARDPITGMWYATNRYDPRCDDKDPAYKGRGY